MPQTNDTQSVNEIAKAASDKIKINVQEDINNIYISLNKITQSMKSNTYDFSDEDKLEQDYLKIFNAIRNLKFNVDNEKPLT